MAETNIIKVGEGRVEEGLRGVGRSLESKTSQSDSLHLAQRNLVLGSVIELSCSRRLMASHLLGVLKPSMEGTDAKRWA